MTKNQRNQRRQAKRGLYKRKRQRKIQRLKHTGCLDDYLIQKRGIGQEPKIEYRKAPKRSWWQRLKKIRSKNEN